MIQKNILYTLSINALIYNLIGTSINLIIASVALYYFLPLMVPWLSPILVIGIIIPLGYLSVFLAWKFFEYMITDTGIMIRHGFIFRTVKTINFNDLQNARAHYGPISMLCGVKVVNGFTASPAQVRVSSNGDGASTTTIIPDIHVVLRSDEAEELVQLMHKTDIQKVQIISS